MVFVGWCSAARHHFVEQVNFSENELGADGAKALADCLKTNTTITQVRRFLHGHVWRTLCCFTALLYCAAARRQGA